MTEVYWTSEARFRLRQIHDYIVSQHLTIAADEVVAAIVERTQQLVTAPLSGRELPGYPEDDIRELLIRPYRIIYRVTVDQVQIITVMHYRQQIPEAKPPRISESSTTSYLIHI